MGEEGGPGEGGRGEGEEGKGKGAKEAAGGAARGEGVWSSPAGSGGRVGKEEVGRAREEEGREAAS